MKKTFAVVTVVLFALALASGCSKKETKAPPVDVDVDAMVEDAIAAVSGGKLDEGMSLFKKVLEAAPDHPRAHCGIGTIYREKGDYAKAIEYYNKAVELDPGYVICTHLLGFAYLKVDDFEKSEEFLIKANELDPAYADSHYDLGQLYALAGRGEEAVAELESFMGLSKAPSRIEEAKALIEKIKSDENKTDEREE